MPKVYDEEHECWDYEVPCACDATWVHDCDECIYLGSSRSNSIYNDGRPSVKVDYYYHKQQAGGFTIITRYGDEGPDYQSGIQPTVDSMNALHLAMGRRLVVGLTVSGGR